MPFLGEGTVVAIDKAKQQRIERFNKLTAVKFDPDNKVHMDALTEYTNHFQMVLAGKQASHIAADFMKGYVGYLVLSLLLPIPEFVEPLFNLAFYAGLIGIATDYSTNTDFNNSVKEMHQLYNWAMREGVTDTDTKDFKYNEVVDASDKLTYPQIQRLIQVLAPVSRPESLQAWPTVSDKPATEAQGTLSWIANSTASAVTGTASYFWSSQNNGKPLTVGEADKIKQLKIQVETGEVPSGLVKSLGDKDNQNYLKTQVLATVKQPIMDGVNSAKGLVFSQ